MAQPSARPLTAAHGWKHLVHMIPIQCVPDQLGRISLVEMTSMYMDITMTAAGKLRDNFLSWHPAVAKGHSQIAPSDIVMTPKRVGCFLAYVDPSLRSVAPPDWAIWGEPRADYNSARPPTKRTQDADIGERPKKKVRFNLPENPLAEFKAVTAPDKQKTSMDWERSRVAINGMTFLFSTGQTDAVRHPGLELCAVSHKFGKFRLVWDWRPNAEFCQKNCALRPTGLSGSTLALIQKLDCNRYNPLTDHPNGRGKTRRTLDFSRANTISMRKDSSEKIKSGTGATSTRICCGDS